MKNRFDPSPSRLKFLRRQRRALTLRLATAAVLSVMGVQAIAQPARPATPPAAPALGPTTPAAPPTAPARGPATPAAPPTVPTVPGLRPATQSSTRPNGNGSHYVTTQPGGGIKLNFRDAPIDAVLDELAAAAGYIIVKEGTPPTGRVSLISPQVVKVDEIVPLLNTVLKDKKYAAVRQGRTLKIMTIDQARRSNIPVFKGNDPSQIKDTDELITQVIPLKGADVTQLKNELSTMISTDADFTANASSNSLIVTDTSSNIKRIVEIVEKLDSTAIEDSQVKVFVLQNASATATAKLITDVFSEQAAAQGGGGNPFQRFFNRGGRGGRGGGGGGGPFGGGGERGGRGESGGEGTGGRKMAPVKASADDRTNRVVVSGPVDVLTVIERVIKELDADPAITEEVKIYRLKNAQSLNLEGVLNDLFNGTNTSSGSRGGSVNPNRNTLGSNRNSGFGGSSNSFGGGGRGGGSSFGGSGGFGNSSRGGNSSFGGGNNNRFGGGGGGGRNFSSRSNQTAADLNGQVTIIADPDTNSLIVRTNPKNYDRVWKVIDELDRPVPQVLIKVLVAEVTHDDSTDLGAEFSVLNLRASGNGSKGGTSFGLKNLTGGMVAQILETNFTATIRALESVGKLDVLSRPYILASDNQLASITVGQEVPFVDSSRITDTGQTINTLSYKDVGILLDVVPHINTEGLVILDVAPTISALTGETVPITEGAGQPVVATRSAQTRVGIMDGQTIVIGGLMEDRKTETVDKVPILGDIPIIGEAFKRHQQKKTKTELLIFLTPHVAAAPESLKGMSKDELEGSKLVPKAVDPNAFHEQYEGLQRGEAQTRPTAPKAPERKESKE